MTRIAPVVCPGVGVVSKRVHVVLTVLLLVVLSQFASGQAATGLPPFGSFGGGSFDTVNLANLNVHFLIPILSKPGRGLPFHYAMDYESSIWVPTTSGSVTQWQPVNTNFGWSAQSEALTGSVPRQSLTLGCGVGAGKTTYGATLYLGYKDTFGTLHPAQIETSPGSNDSSCIRPEGDPIPGGTVTAKDGSGYVLTATNSQLSVQNRSGWTIQFNLVGGGTVTDTNGNQLTTSVSGSTTTFKDTLGGTVLTVDVVSSAQTTYSYTAPSGATAKYTFNYTAKTVQTNFGCANITEFPATTENLLTSITLPDSTSSYTFTYEPTPGHSGAVTGRIASVTLPTGGIITYTYSGGSNGIFCDGTIPTLVRKTPDGSWNYQHTEASNQWDTSVTDPAGNLTTAVFQGIYEVSRVVHQLINGSQMPFYDFNTCYNGNTTNCATTAVNLPITERNRTYTFTGTAPGSGVVNARTDTFFNNLGLVTKVDQYAYGATAPGGLLQETTTSYGSYNASNATCTALGNNILDRPCSVVATDGTHTLSSTTYTYDEGSTTGSHGNVTTISQLVGGSATLSKHISYFDTGTPNVVTDVNGAATTYGYGTNSCNGAYPDSITPPITSLAQSMTYNCTGGVLTSVTDANQHTSSVNYTADAFFWRPESTRDFAGATTAICYGLLSNGSCTLSPTQVESALTFGSSTVDIFKTIDSLGRPSLTQVKQSPSAANYDSTQQIYNVAGMNVQTTVPYSAGAVVVAPNGTGATTTTYDALGRPTQVQDAGGGTISFSYSANDVMQTLGPKPSGENTKQKQLEYDALGRLTSVCEMTLAAGNYLCNQSGGQNTAARGFLTTYAYGVDSSGHPTVTVNQNKFGGPVQARVYTYDLLGRLVQEQNPESGTRTYVYDTVLKPCNGDTVAYTYLGDLVQSGNVGTGNCEVYFHDALHRLTDVGSSAQTTTNPCKRFLYDNSPGYPGSTKPSGLVNTMGRLVEALTDACISHTNDAVLTQEWFSYDADGRQTDVFESTPNSGGYYHTSAAYFPNGALQSLSGIPGLAAMTYTLDGEGRLSTAVHGNVNVVCDASCSSASTLYNTAGQPTTINIGGTGDNDAYTYDAVGRMKKYTYTVGSTPASMNGTLTWNANGTLQQLAITDGFNASGTQTCTYTYDDWVRMSSVNCVDPSNTNVWGQNFVYDPYGDITKSVPTNATGIAWACGGTCYDQTKNQYNSTLSPSISYDADGNLLNDTFHTYTWDVYGKLSTIDSSNCASNGTCLTYDALGRVVEKSKNGNFTQVLYSPVGKTAVLSGQNIVSAYLPLPGGATEFESAVTNHTFWHKDWLGSVRLASTVVARNVVEDRAYAPFGESYASIASGQLNFTGDTQDLIAGTFDTDNRELNPNQGRWLSPDPAGLAVVDFTNPQSFNRYSYALNNPLAFVDPSGTDEEDACDLDSCPGGGDAGGGGGGDPCSDIGFSDANAECQDPGGFFNGQPVPPPFGGGGGGGGGNGGTPSNPGAPGHSPNPPQSAPTSPTGTGAPPWQEIPTPSFGGLPGLLPGSCGDFIACGLPGPGGDTFSPGLAGAAGGTIVCEFLEPCGAVEDTALVIALFAGAVIHQLAKTNAQDRYYDQVVVPTIESRCGRQLTPDERRRLHDEITGQNFSPDEIVEIGVGLFCPGH